ncbi:MAG: GNAT family N-acetyltransferase [Pseudomonadales bacterium]|nr:GNAT family N-acetyltransferase [Pseudomonadales bacterium]
MNVSVVKFDEQFAAAFAALNYQWIEHYFKVEEEDRKALDNPVKYALEPGGEIFFVLEDGEPVGTVAIVPKEVPKEVPKQAAEQMPKPTKEASKCVFELAKMAVRPDRQGRGYSKLLMDHCLDFARAQGADEVMLVTNDILAPALGLYTAAGFVATQYSDSRYERGNLEMHLTLA